MLKSKVAVVTGAGHPDGIGRGIADKLAEQGARVIITDLDSSEAALISAVQDYNKAGLDVSMAVMDVTKAEEVNQRFKEINESHGRIDILVNNAGVGVGSSDFMALTDKDWELSLNVNVLGVSNCCQAVLPFMLEQNKGAIVNVSSLAGLGAIEAIPVSYTASKYAVVGITKQLAVNYAQNNIRVNAVCPGTIKTQMHNIAMNLIAESYDMSFEQAEELEMSRIPIGKFGMPHDVGNTVAFLASDTASFITGICIPVAGGLSPGL